jgi:hypothetical protein
VAWTKANVTVTANNSADPIGTTTADRVVETAATGEHRVQNTAVLSVTAGTVYTASVYAKAGEVTILRIGFDDQAKLPARVFFNLSNGTVSFTEAGAGTITSVGNGWYRCTITGTCGTSHSSRIELNLVQTGTTASYAGNTSNGLLLWGAQYETGSSATAYQKVGLTSDVTESGKRDCWGLLFDGSDDSLQTSEISFNTWTQATRRNLLTDTESLGASSWTRNNITAVDNTTDTTDPLGTNTSTKLTASSSVVRCAQNFTGRTAGENWVFSFYVKAGTATQSEYLISNGLAETSNSSGVFTFSSATFSGALGTYVTSRTATSVGNGWYRIVLICTIPSGQTAIRFNPALPIVNTETAYYWGAQAELATSATDYQRVGTDKMTVMAGVRKNSDAAVGMIVELTASLGGNNGSFAVFTPNTPAATTYSFGSRGSTAVIADSSSGFAAPLTSVATLQANIASDSVLGRLNSAQVATSSSDQGSGNYSNAIVYIGARGGSSFRLNGIIYTLIIRGATTPTGTIADFEKNLLRLRAGLGAF